MMVKKETRLRSSSKSVLWRIAGILILAVITYAYTKQWVTTGIITVVHHAIFFVIYYVHERLWLKVIRPRNLMLRSIFKMFTYETLMGNLILGLITYLVTASWQQMTAITISYISIKHILYVWNEFIWAKIKIGARL